MTTQSDGPVRPQDLRELLDSDLTDPVLVLQEGRVAVVAADDRAGLEIVTRAELVQRVGGTAASDADLELQATQLSTAVDTLGG